MHVLQIMLSVEVEWLWQNRHFWRGLVADEVPRLSRCSKISRPANAGCAAGGDASHLGQVNGSREPTPQSLGFLVRGRLLAE